MDWKDAPFAIILNLKPIIRKARGMSRDRSRLLDRFFLVIHSPLSAQTWLPRHPTKRYVSTAGLLGRLKVVADSLRQAFIQSH